MHNQNIFNAYHFTKKFSKQVNFALANSLDFLRVLNANIDILYLDSLDGNIPGANDHQLKEAEIAIKNLNSDGLVILDDKGGKTDLSIPFFLKNGWKIIFENDQQVLLSK